MGVLNTLLQQRQMGQQNLIEGIQGISGMQKAQRMKEIGNRFLEYNDFTAEGLQRFAQENNVQIEDMQQLVQLVKKFRELQPKAEPRTTLSRNVEEFGLERILPKSTEKLSGTERLYERLKKAVPGSKEEERLTAMLIPGDTKEETAEKRQFRREEKERIALARKEEKDLKTEERKQKQAVSTYNTVWDNVIAAFKSPYGTTEEDREQAAAVTEKAMVLIEEEKIPIHKAVPIAFKEINAQQKVAEEAPTEANPPNEGFAPLGGTWGSNVDETRTWINDAKATGIPITEIIIRLEGIGWEREPEDEVTKHFGDLLTEPEITTPIIGVEDKALEFPIDSKTLPIITEDIKKEKLLDKAGGKTLDKATAREFLMQAARTMANVPNATEKDIRDLARRIAKRKGYGSD